MTPAPVNAHTDAGVLEDSLPSATVHLSFLPDSPAADLEHSAAADSNTAIQQQEQQQQQAPTVQVLLP